MANTDPKGFCTRQTQREWKAFFDEAPGAIRLVLLETGVDGGALLSQVQAAVSLFRGMVSLKVINIIECTSILKTFQIDAVPALLVFWGKGLVERWTGLRSSSRLASEMASRLSGILTRAGGRRPALPQPPPSLPAPRRPGYTAPPVAPPAPPAPAPQPAAGAKSAQLGRLLSLVNQARQNAGAGPLQINENLGRTAEAHAADMGHRGFYNHINPEGEGPAERQSRIAPINWLAIGENIDKDEATADAVFQSWMNSPHHRENILRPNFTHIGLGLYVPTRHWVQVFAQLPSPASRF